MKKGLIVLLVLFSSFFPEPKEYHTVVFLHGGCVMDIWAWNTFSMIGHLRVETWNYRVKINCGGNVVNSSWRIEPNQMITNLNNISEVDAIELSEQIEAEME